MKQKKHELLLNAWNVVLSFKPKPTYDEVFSLAHLNHPPAQAPAPKTPSTGKSIKTDIGKTPTSVSKQGPSSGTGRGRGRPPNANRVTLPDPAPRPSFVSSEESSSSSDEGPAPQPSQATPSGEGKLNTSSTSKGTSSGQPSTKVPKKDEDNAKLIWFTINQPRHDPQLRDGLALIAGDFTSQLTGFLSRYSHQDYEPSAGEAEATPPVRPVGDFGDLNELLFADVFDNVHDPRITSYTLAFRHFSTRDYFLGKMGRDYSCRGRGPVWSANSCALDAVIVAARLLDIGHLAIDTGRQTWQEWAEGFNDFDQACLRVFREPWDIQTEAESIRRRDAFYHQVIDESKKRGPAASLRNHGHFQASTKVWDLCTSMANQFYFGQFSRSFCTACQEQTRIYPEPDNDDPDIPRGMDQRDIAFDELEPDSDERPDMAQMLIRHFAKRGPLQIHQDCEISVGDEPTVQVRRRIVYAGALPPRLVVKPSLRYRNIPGATNDNITFTYPILPADRNAEKSPWRDTGVDKRTDTYRWLGGIYKHQNHYRVYWQDSEYVISNGDFKVYDGQKFLGAIVGDLPPCAPGSKVPEEWAEGTDILFYERINQSDHTTVMTKAKAIVAKVARAKGRPDAPNLALRPSTQQPQAQPQAQQPQAQQPLVEQTTVPKTTRPP